MIVQCSVCSHEYNTETSPDCPYCRVEGMKAVRAQREDCRATGPRKPGTGFCEWCGKPLVGRRWFCRFCNANCGSSYSRAGKRARGDLFPDHRLCECGCGKPLYSRQEKQRWATRPCKLRARRAARAIRRAEKEGDIPDKRHT